MDIKKLIYFCAIVDHGNLSNAAKFLNITQPPLSVHLKELEESLGETLLIRKGKQVTLTPEGHLFYNKAVKLLRQINEFEFDLRNRKKQKEQSIKVGVASPAHYFIQNLIKDWQAKGRPINIELMTSSIYAIEQALQEGMLDFAIVRQPLAYSNYTVANLGSFHHVAVYPPCLTAPDKDEISVHDIADLNLILPKAWADKSTRFNDHIRKEFYKAGITPKVIFESDIHDVLLSFVKSGVEAITFLPNIFRERNDVSELQFRTFIPTLSFESIIIYRSDIYLSENILDVIHDIVKNYRIRRTY